MTLSGVLAGSLLAALTLGAIDSLGIVRAGGVDYERDIKPMLAARCYACQGALKQEAGLRLDTGSSIRRGGDGGVACDTCRFFRPLIVPGTRTSSLRTVIYGCARP